LLTACMLLGLCACGGQSGAASGQPNTPASQQVPPKPVESSAPEQNHAQAESSAPADKSQKEETPPAPSAVSADAQTIGLQKQLYGLYQWDDADLLVKSEFSHVTLWQGDAEKHPELAEALEQTANMLKRSMEDEYDNLCADAWESHEPAVSTLDIQVRRADNVVLSLLSDSYSDHGLIEEFRGMHGANYDVQTGKELALDDVVKINNDLAQAVIKELSSHMWAGDFYSDDTVEQYFANTPYDGFSWTLDYNGVTFYFADGELAEAGNGRQTATVSFAEHPELFEEKYMHIPAAYMVELPLDSSFFTDLDGDGDLEELNVTGWYDSDMGMYSDFGIYTDTDGYYHYEEFAADSYAPYYVKTADGHHYLYLFCEQLEGYGPWFVLKVFDISGGRFTSVGTMNVGPACISDDIYLIPTDPEVFYLDDFDSMEQNMITCSVGAAGLPEIKETDAAMG